MNPATASLLRVVDANLNRSREGLRVVEEYSRFVLNDPRLSGLLKELRHELEESTRAIARQAVVFRDTAGDVGTTIGSNLTRSTPADVVRANASRLGEALRAVEEYVKPVDSAVARRVEALRYRFYEIERTLALRLKPASRLASVRLMVIVTESVCRRPWLEAARLALEGGAGCLQLREKSLEGGELLKRARALVELGRSHDAIIIVNDRPDIALLAGADGVHVGQTDLPAREARKVIGGDGLLGVSTHAPADAQRAVDDGADYIGVGPVFRSSTKPRDFVLGTDSAAQIAAAVTIPTFAIAGIDADNAHELTSRFTGIAVSRAVLGDDDPAGAARRLIEALVSREHV